MNKTRASRPDRLDHHTYDHRTRGPVVLLPTPDPEPRTVIAAADVSPRRFTMRAALAMPRVSIAAAVLMIGHFLGEALVPTLMGLAIDRAVATSDLGSLLIWIVILAADFALLSWTWRFGERLAVRGKQTVEHRLRMQVTERILDPRGMAGPTHLPGTLLNIATSDVTRVANALFLGIFPVGELAAVLFAGVVLLSISWPLGVAILVGAPTVLWVLDLVGGPLRRHAENEQQVAGEAAGIAADLVAGVRIVKGLGVAQEATARYRRASQRALAATVRQARSEGAYVGITQIMSSLLVVGIGVAAGALALTGTLSVGELITVVGLTQFVIGPLTYLGRNVGAIWNTAVPSAKRVLAILAAPPAATAGEETRAAGPIEIDAVTDGTLAPIELTIPEVGLTVITAPSEVSALITDILARRRDPSAGEVRLGGHPVGDLRADALRSAVCVLPHVPDLFEGTLADNITAGIPAANTSAANTSAANTSAANTSGAAGADDARIAAAILASASDEVIEVVPGGLDAQVGEGGQLLSGGQRQRIALARGIAARPPTLVLDDPTSAVDSVTESIIVERITAARAGLATVVFTSSPAFIAAADTLVAVQPQPDAAAEIAEFTGGTGSAQ